MNECKYCGRQCNDEFCCDEHREYQRIYDEGEYVSCPECGVQLKALGTHLKYKHENLQSKFPKIKKESKKTRERLTAATVASLSRVEVKMKLSAKRKNRKLSEKTRENMRIAQKFTQNSFVTKERNIQSKLGKKRSEKTRRTLSIVGKEVQNRPDVSQRKRLAQLRKVREGTHPFIRDIHGACRGHEFERQFDSIFYSESFTPNSIRTTTSTLRVFDGWDPEDLSELYREKFVFECDFFNDELNVDFEIDEEHHFDQIDYDYERDAHFLKDRATLTFRYRLFDVLTRKSEIDEDIKCVISELRKGNRNVKSKFEYTKEECRRKWEEYFEIKVSREESK